MYANRLICVSLINQEDSDYVTRYCAMVMLPYSSRRSWFTDDTLPFRIVHICALLHQVRARTVACRASHINISLIVRHEINPAMWKRSPRTYTHTRTLVHRVIRTLRVTEGEGIEEMLGGTYTRLQHATHMYPRCKSGDTRGCAFARLRLPVRRRTRASRRICQTFSNTHKSGMRSA